jgi:hypothetical protein
VRRRRACDPARHIQSRWDAERISAWRTRVRSRALGGGEAGPASGHRVDASAPADLDPTTDLPSRPQRPGGGAPHAHSATGHGLANHTAADGLARDLPAHSLRATLRRTALRTARRRTALRATLRRTALRATLRRTALRTALLALRRRRAITNSPLHRPRPSQRSSRGDGSGLGTSLSAFTVNRFEAHRLDRQRLRGHEARAAARLETRSPFMLLCTTLRT